MTLLNRRTLIVTGKGGVGKTTVCVALGLAAAAQNRRVLLVETSGAQRIPPLFGSSKGGYEAHALAENLWTLSITPEAAIEDYVVQQLRFRSLFQLVFRNRIVAPFVDAVPGLHDAVQLGKIFDLERATHANGTPQWDLLVVDAPATGHGLTMLGSARTMMELTQTGPMFEGVRQVQTLMADPKRVGLVLVSLPEAMPTQETIELYQQLNAEQRQQVAAIVLNSVYPAPLPSSEWTAALPLLQNNSPAVSEAKRLVEQWMQRVAQQQDARQALHNALPGPHVELPRHVNGAPSLSDLQQMGETLLAQGAP